MHELLEAVYTYNVQTKRFKSYIRELYREPRLTMKPSDYAAGCDYAITNDPNDRFAIAIDPAPLVVTRNSRWGIGLYSVWLYQENESLAKRLLFDHIRAENQDLIRQYEYKIDSALKRISNAERILLANSQ